MADLPMPPATVLPGDNDTPLPLIVAKRWNFPLAYIDTEKGRYYAIQDWIRGLLQVKNVHSIWANFKKDAESSQLLISDEQLGGTPIRKLPYKSSDNKTYDVNHTTDEGLYLIAQYLRVTKKRPLLDQIRNFLAAAGAFVDEVRLDPDKALDAFIQGHRADGKDDHWIAMRALGKLRRNLFTSALTAAIAETLTPRHYAMATDDIYRGLWGRTAAHLKRQLDVPKNASLRDKQPMMGLYYQGIAEEAAAYKLGDREELTWTEAREIVQTVAAFVGKQAAEMAQFMQMDLATGAPLLSSQLK